MYLALYRKYRPRNFDEIVGQEHIVKTLMNQIKMDKISHAYLFTGSRGTGKTSTAKIFARAINCLNPKDGLACGECEVCKELSSNNVDILEIDAASNNGVDEIRELREKVKYPPIIGKYKVYIIDEVHMLSSNAFNALLKTLEEPPKYTVFILATTEVHKIPATILSRCLRFDFRLVSLENLTNLLKKIFNMENIAYDEESVNIIARAGDGSVRDCLSIADRCISFSGNNLTSQKVISVLGISEKNVLVNIANKILAKDIGQTLIELDSVLSMGTSPLVFSNDLIAYFRDLLIINAMGTEARKIVIVKDDIFSEMEKQSISKNYAVIVKAIEILSEIEQELRYSVQPRIVLETTLIKIVNDSSILERVEKLEKIVKNKFPSD